MSAVPEPLPFRIPGARDALDGALDGLSEADLEIVGRFVRAMAAPVEQWLGPGSWLTTAPWADAFAARLRAHHALNPEPLSTTAFEAAFNAACRAAGWEVAPAASATHRFYDTAVILPGAPVRRISLKASAARDLRRGLVHISKLTEAAWIQDARTQADRRAKLVELFAEYRAQTEGIVMLRCFRDEVPGALCYELVEIPTTVFASVDDLGIADAQASTIAIPPGAAVPDARIRIDRSDAKITVTGIRTEVCTVHGRWTVPGSADLLGPIGAG
jgi:hypothetical protein